MDGDRVGKTRRDFKICRDPTGAAATADRSASTSATRTGIDVQIIARLVNDREYPEGDVASFSADSAVRTAVAAATGRYPEHADSVSDGDFRLCDNAALSAGATSGASTAVAARVGEAVR
jgi:hypothetical protein